MIFQGRWNFSFKQEKYRKKIDKVDKFDQFYEIFNEHIIISS